MIVVDTNIIAYRFIQGAKTSQVLSAQQIDPVWIVPYLWRHEFLNVLSTIIRNEVLSEYQGTGIWKSACRCLHNSEQHVDMIKSLSLSINRSISAYDAQYISLAVSLGVRCLTEDKQLLKKIPETAISLSDYIALEN